MTLYYAGLSKLLVCNVAVFDVSQRDRKETMTRGADQFDALLGIFNPFLACFGQPL